ncbi:MAG: DUF1385 domain-containing protein [Lachnospiraceae bacterium]|nr:DUF1385 domain-containing protein [Lachnospiraceae bacterium]
MSRPKCSRSCGIGGQAVLEGVMMKKGDLYAVTVRKPNGDLVIDTEEFHGVMHGSKIKKTPFIRGIFNFVDSLILGTRTLNYSAEFFEDESAKETKFDQWFKKIFKDKADGIVAGITVTLSIVLAIAIFMVLPYFISSLLDTFVRNSTILAVIEGIIRLAIFVGYVILISAMEDIKRVYMYHGAEHKCINCIERGRKLTVDNVMASSRLHKRCGTSFMLFVMLVSIILFMFIKVDNPIMRVVVRMLLVPVIAGISYEIIRLAGNNSNNIFVKIISAPGMWLQTLTTKEPTTDMVEVAIKSVEAVFDWKEYLKEEFGYSDEWMEEEEEISSES